jgi:hypothetical protein
MFLHHTMTDSEILRTCEGCESPHLRLVADRLRTRVDEMREIHKLARQVVAGTFASHVIDAGQQIMKLSDPK